MVDHGYPPSARTEHLRLEFVPSREIPSPNKTLENRRLTAGSFVLGVHEEIGVLGFRRSAARASQLSVPPMGAAVVIFAGFLGSGLLHPFGG